MKRNNLIDKKFNRLVVVKFLGSLKGKRIWECICECGNKTIVTTGDLTTGHTKSCGCLNKETQISTNTTHGMRKTRIYNTWSHMKRRCLNTSDSRYKDYGGRGIKVCEKWLNFKGFYEDMKNGYADNLTLDRIDVNGNYCIENCRWSTIEEQCNNKRTNRVKTVDGITGTIANLSKKYGIDQRLVANRIERGWTTENAFKKDVRPMITRIETVNGVTGTIASLSRHFNMKKCTVFYRLNKGWSIEDALLIPPQK